MFINYGFRPGNEFWRYLLGSAFIILLLLIGYIPYKVAIDLRYQETGETVDPSRILQYLEPNPTLFYNLLPLVFALGGIWIVSRYFHWQPMRELITGRPKTDWKRVFFAFFLWAAIAGGSIWISYLMKPGDYKWNFQPEPFAIMAVISLLMIPIQTSVEELVFRGYLLQGFALLAKNRWFPLLLTSTIFGLLHGFNPEVERLGYLILIYYIGTGFFLGIITLMDDGAELAIGFHAANNLVGALLVTADWTALQTHSVLKDMSEPSLSFEVFLPVFVIFPILLFIFKRRYNWSGWTEKLTGKLP